MKQVKTVFTFSLKLAAVLLTLAVFVKVFLFNEGNAYADDLQETFAIQVEKAEAVEKKPSPVKTTPSPNPNAKYIALTFDDGPDGKVTGKILDTLQKYDAKATFFVIGRQVKKDASAVKRAVSLGCEIGNHTWEHRNLTKSSSKETKRTLQRTITAVKKYAGYDIRLVRPTYGEVNKRVKNNVNAPMIAWYVDTEDWKTGNSKKIQKEIYGKVKDGDIILMHDIYPATADAVKKIIPYLKKQGYELVTVSELMERKAIKLKKGTVYYSGRQ